MKKEKRKYCIYGCGARESSTFLQMTQSTDNKDQIYLLAPSKEKLQLKDTKNIFFSDSLEESIKLLKYYEVDIVIILNILYITGGYVNIFQKEGFKVFGTSEELIKLENSKSYTKQFMKKYNIPTPNFSTVDNITFVNDILEDEWKDKKVVIKTDATLYNSIIFPHRVFIPKSSEEAQNHINYLKRVPFYNSQPILIEEKIDGYELSIHLFTDGKTYQMMPFVQDYKKMYEDDEGLNTNGVGSFSTTHQVIDKNLEIKIKREIIEPFLDGVRAEFDVPYKSILYLGIMVLNNGEVQCLECNVRSGNPEWPTLIELLETPFQEIVTAIENQELSKLKIQWKQEYYSMCVMMCGAGYPYTTLGQNYEIEGLDKVDKSVKILKENMFSKDGKHYTDKNAERVLGIVSSGKNLGYLRNKVYKNLNEIKYKGYYYRDDIAKNGFKLR